MRITKQPKPKKLPKRKAKKEAARLVPPAPPAPEVPSPRAPRGRPSGLTQALQDEIVRNITATGCTLADAAGAVGFTDQTVYDWRGRGRTGEQPFADFLVATDRAVLIAKLRDLSVIAKAALNGDWKAAAWRIERRFPKEFAQRVYNIVNEELDGAVVRLTEAFANEPDQLERILAALAGEQGRASARATEGEPTGEAAAGGGAVGAVPAEPAAAGVPHP